jgi:hypothetical protein
MDVHLPNNLWRHGLKAALVVTTLASVTTLTACGGSSGSAPSKTADVSSCLHKAGIASTGKGASELPPGMSPTQLVAALRKCGVRTGDLAGSLEPGVVTGAKREMAERELVKQVTCLHEHGFDVTVSRNVKEKLFNANGVNTRSARFRAADEECRQKFVEAIRKLGSGFGLEHGSGATPQAATSLGARRAAVLASCVRKYGATVVQTDTLIGLRVPSDTSPTRLHEMLENCDSVGNARV